jgi:hypothetical protein
LNKVVLAQLMTTLQFAGFESNEYFGPYQEKSEFELLMRDQEKVIARKTRAVLGLPQESEGIKIEDPGEPIHMSAPEVSQIKIPTGQWEKVQEDYEEREFQRDISI